jgi:hypothetical protein
MATRSKKKLARRAPERRAPFEAEADRLHTEHLTLGDLRKARALARGEKVPDTIFHPRRKGS